MKESLFPSTSGCRIPRREVNKPSTSFISTKFKHKQKQQQRLELEICSSSSSSSRDPFQDLSTGGGGSIILNASSSNASSSVSSIEAPRGCLRFFLNHSSKPTSNNSNRRKNNNNQNHRPLVKLKPISSVKIPNQNTQSNRRGNDEKVVKGNQRESGRNAKPSSRVSTMKKSVETHVSRLKSGSGDFNPARVDLDSNSTPLRTTGNLSGLNVTKGSNSESSNTTKTPDSESSNTTKTPPLHSTVSPEIQCPASVISTAKKSVTITPVCYGAGHLLSGVTDKRKCRPRGLLVVGEEIVVDKFVIDDHDSGGDVLVDGRNTAIDDLSPSSLPVKASMHWLIHSPGNSKDSPEFGGFPAANLNSDMDIFPLSSDRHPFSMDLLSRVNVVETPESDSSSSRVRNIVTKCWGSELDSVDRDLQKLFSTPATTPSLRFNVSATTSSDHVDLIQLQKSIDIRDARLLSSTLDDVSRSKVRISWRDGLVSRIFELDEFDCCRCLSDEEDDMEEEEENDCNNGHLEESHQTRKLDIGNPEHCLDRNVKDDVASKVCCLPAAAESMAISSDGGALFQSDDSDWTQCYKN